MNEGLFSTCGRIFAGLMSVVALVVTVSTTQVSAQSVSPETGLSAYPNGGPGLVTFVSNSVIAYPTGSEEFMSVALETSLPVQNSIGAGLARAYRTLFDNGNTEDAGLIVVAICRWPDSMISAAFAATLKRTMQDICAAPWSNGTGRRPSLFSVRALGPSPN